MIRYIRLYLHFLRFSLSKAMQFRVDFFFRIVMDLNYNAISILFFNILYSHTNIIGEWNQEQMYIFIGTFLTIDALNMTIFANNTWWLPFYINRGDLDYYLTRPVSGLFMLSLREFAANSFINLSFAIAILIWAFINSSITYSLTHIFIYIFMVFNGLMVMYGVRMVFTLPVFWTQSQRGFASVLDMTMTCSERPHQIFKGAWKRFMTTLLPFALIASYPCTILFDPKVRYDLIIHALSVCGAFLLFTVLLWKRGLKSYSSASS